MIKKITWTIHTERLHDEVVWSEVKKIVDFFGRYNIRAIWFAVNPACAVYRQMGFDERKWKERLRYLSARNQIIEQHTHFYEGRKGNYNLSYDYVKKRLIEDKNWLESLGYKIRGFVSGAWLVNNDLEKALRDLDYQYHWTKHPATISVKNAFLRIIRLRSKQKEQLIYFHDYELANPLFRSVLKFLIYLIGDKNDILLHPHDHKRRGDWRLIFKFLNNNFGQKNLRSVLELGAGMGNISNFFVKKGVAVVAEDINGEYLKTINQRDKNITVLQHDINTPLPFPDNSFDLITCIGTLHYGYIKNPESILREMTRVTKNYLLVDFLSRYAPYRLLEKIYNPNYNPRSFTSSEAEQLVAGLGLKIIDRVGSRSLPPVNRFFPYTGKTVYLILKK